MFIRKRHPSDETLVRRYMADRGLDALKPEDARVVRHVDQCAACARRYASVCLQLDAAAAAAVETADAVFTAERLVAQRERIMRRLDGAGARVLTFPAADAERRAQGPDRPLLKWVSVAAAAGLLVGLSVGSILDLGGSGSAPQTARSVGPTRGVPVIGAVRPVGTAADDTFLSDLELALSEPRIPELQAIDALTLSVRDQRPPDIKD